MRNSLKNLVQNREVSIGSWITIAHTAVAEIMAKSGFDWLTVDMEHSAITLSEAQHLIQVIDLCGVLPLVRVGENNPTLIKRVMDAGAGGVIVPMVNSQEDALSAVKAVKYPPKGMRGVGLARAQGYGFEFETYKDWLDKESLVIVQIEHIEAVRNLDKILSVEGVDGFIVGPYDLSASMGKPGEFQDPAVREALLGIIDRARQYPVFSGFHVVEPDIGQVYEKIEQGYSFIGFSVDMLFLGTSCRKGLEGILNQVKQ